MTYENLIGMERLPGGLAIATTKVPLTEVFKGTGVMLLGDGISLVVLMFFPILSTWLPSMMK